MPSLRILLVCACVYLFLISTSVAQPYQEGDKVVVISAAPLETLNQSPADVFVGLPLTIQKVEGDRLLVSNGNPGWLESRHVLPTEKALEHFNERLQETPDDTTLLSARANSLAALERLDEAIAEFTKLVELEPDEMSHRNERAGCYIQQREFAKAIEDFDVVVSTKPMAEVLVNRASCQMQLEEWELARIDLMAATKFFPDYALGWKLLGDLALGQEQLEAAAAAYKGYVDLMPQDGDVWFEMGNIFLQLGESDQALEALDQALRLQPDNILVHRNRAILLRETGQTDLAIEAFTEMMKRFPNDYTGFVNRGMLHKQADRYQQAIEDLTSAIKIQPESAFCYFHRGLAYRALGYVGNALSDMSHALARDEKPEGLVERGELYQDLGDFDLAIADFTRALELQPTRDYARVARGQTLERQGKFDEAIADFTQVIDRDPPIAALQPTREYARLARAWAYEKQGKYAEAIADFTAAIDGDAQLPEVYIMRGRAFRKFGKWAEAKLDFEKSLELAPDNALAIYSLAWFLATVPDESLRDADRAVELAVRGNDLSKSREPLALDALATAYAAQGRFDQAVEIGERAIALKNAKKLDGLEMRLQLFRNQHAYVDDGKEEPEVAKLEEKVNSIPDGFELQTLEPEGEIIKPLNWKFDSMAQSGTVVYRIWEPLPHNEEQFDVSVTINIVSNAEESGKTPSEFARDYLESLGRSGTVVEEIEPTIVENQTQLGMVIDQVLTVNDREGEYRSKFILMADDENGMLTVIIFGSLASRWDEMEPTFRLIAQHGSTMRLIRAKHR